MQNRYVGDIGDFGKFGLLRSLLGYRDTQPVGCSLRLGIVWYLYPDQTHNSDGKYTGYLTNASAKNAALRSCDPELYDSLRRVVIGNNRNVIGIRRSAIFPEDTTYYEKTLSYPRGAAPASRHATRATWFEGAREATAEADVVFVDPDNGISETVHPLQKNGPKFVTLNELRQFTERNQDLVIYHHLGRRGTAAQQIKNVAQSLQLKLNLSRTPWSLWYHRGTARAYFVIPQERHETILKNRLTNFLNGPWSAHFELIDSPLRVSPNPPKR